MVLITRHTANSARISKIIGERKSDSVGVKSKSL